MLSLQNEINEITLACVISNLNLLLVAALCKQFELTPVTKRSQAKLEGLAANTCERHRKFSRDFLWYHLFHKPTPMFSLFNRQFTPKKKKKSQPILESLNGTGRRPLSFDSCLLNHPKARAICAWNDVVVTVSEYNPRGIKVWNEDLQLLHSRSFNNLITLLIAWDDLLICGSTSKLEYWKLKKSNQLKRIKKIKTEWVCGGAVWNNELWINSWNIKDKSICLDVLNKRGEVLHSRKIREEFDCMFVWNDSLVVVTLNGSLQKWQRSDRTKGEIQLVKTFSSCVHSVTLWRNTRIAAGLSNGNILVWDENGNVVFTLVGIPSVAQRLTEWLGRLVSSSAQTLEDKTRSCVLMIWNWDGSLYQRIAIDPHTPKGMVEFKKRLWHCSKILKVYADASERWRTKRLLWIGFMKNQAAECVLARLCKDLVVAIALYL